MSVAVANQVSGHNGQLTGVSGARNETFGYDANGNRNPTGYTVGTGNQITTDPAGNTLNYLGGNLSTKTDSSGNVWTYTFDFHNRLTQVVEKNSGGTTIFTENMTYDVFGNLIGDKVNGTQQRWTVFDGPAKVWTCHYDLDGNLTRVVPPVGVSCHPQISQISQIQSG